MAGKVATGTRGRSITGTGGHAGSGAGLQACPSEFPRRPMPPNLFRSAPNENTPTANRYSRPAHPGGPRPAGNRGNTGGPARRRQNHEACRRRGILRGQSRYCRYRTPGETRTRRQDNPRRRTVQRRLPRRRPSGPGTAHTGVRVGRAGENKCNSSSATTPRPNSSPSFSTPRSPRSPVRSATASAAADAFVSKADALGAIR